MYFQDNKKGYFRYKDSGKNYFIYLNNGNEMITHIFFGINDKKDHAIIFS